MDLAYHELTSTDEAGFTSNGFGVQLWCRYTQAPANPPSTRRLAPQPYPTTIPFAEVPRCFKQFLLDGSASVDPDEGRSWEGGDSFTYAWSLVRSPPPSILSRRTLGDPHASFVQVGATVLLRPDREGTYTCELGVYDGCGATITRTFDVTVAWEQECVTRAMAQRLGFAVPLVFILALILLAGLSFLPPLNWTHPRQVMLDAMAAAVGRCNPHSLILGIRIDTKLPSPRWHTRPTKARGVTWR